MAGDTSFKEVPIRSSSVFTKAVSEFDVCLYAGISGDFSLNHINAQYMRDGAYGHRVAHGTLLLGFMSAVSANLYLGRTVLPGYDRVRFIKPVFFGDTIRTEYKVARYDMEKKRVFADVTCTNVMRSLPW